jgi:hypothetical protein
MPCESAHGHYREIQNPPKLLQSLGDNDVSTTMFYTAYLNRG